MVELSDLKLKVFGSDGRLVRQVGRRGAGPGEFEAVRNILVANSGTIQIIDAALGRRSVFSRDGVFERSTAISGQGGVRMPAILRTNGDIVMNVGRTSPGRGAFLLQVIDSTGRSTLQLEEDDSPWRSNWLQERLLWERRNGEVIVARPYEFTVDVYDRGLSQKREFVRVADWLPSRSLENAPDDGVFDRPYTSRMRGVWEDAHGRIWLHFMLPSDSWQPHRRERSTRPSQQEILRLATRPRVETIVEVIDLQERHVVARWRSDAPLGLPFGGGYFARALDDSSDEPGVMILKARLKP